GAGGAAGENSGRWLGRPVISPVALRPVSPYVRDMNGTRQDVDPSTELLEEDDEQTLPEQEAIDLAAGAGPLAVGRAVIADHVKRAPPAPRVYRMIDRNGQVLYVGKAKNIRKRTAAYTRPTRYHPHII